MTHQKGFSDETFISGLGADTRPDYVTAANLSTDQFAGFVSASPVNSRTKT
jgi:hypothetical protein